MKRLTAVFALAAMLLASCSKFDDSDLQNKYTSLESRVTILENIISSINNNVTSLQRLVSDGSVITGVTEVVDGDGNVSSYVIALSDGTALTVAYTGAEGVSAPEVSAAEDGGVLYWTVNGEWLLYNGEKVPCTGAAPQVKVEGGRWYVSYDGVNWTDIGSATSEGGASGSCLFSSVVKGDGFYTFTLASSGDSFNVAIYEPFALVLESSEVSVEASATVDIPYSITGKTAATTVGVINPGIFTVNVANGKISVTAPASFDEGNVVVYADNGAGATSIRTITVSLYVAPPPAELVFKDSFDWSTSTANSVGSTSNEYGWATLTSNGTNGWTCEQVNGNYNCWGRSGHVRFSRTGYGGVLVSPALSTLTASTDLVVTFSAARWYNAGSGATDANNWFTVYTNDGSTVCATADGTYSDKLTIEITNRYDTADWQGASGSTYTFYVKGATSTTTISWASTGSDGSTSFSGTGRLVLDNIEINKK